MPRTSQKSQDKPAQSFDGPGISVIANRPLTLYEDEKFILYAKQEDVNAKTVFNVPKTAFWKHKVEKETLLSYAPIEKVVLEKENEE